MPANVLGCVRQTASEQVFDDGHVPEGEVIDRQLVVPGAQRPPLLVPPDDPLDDVPPPVPLRVEVRLPGLVRPGRDDRADPPPPDPAADAGERVPLVPGHVPRPPPGPTPGGQHRPTGP